MERARLKCMDLQRELAVLLQENRSTTDEVVKNLQDDIKKERNKSTRSLSDNFTVILKRFCEQHEPRYPTHGTINYLEDGKAQADILIAARKARNLTDAIFANDMDYHAALGDVSISVKELSYKFREKSYLERRFHHDGSDLMPLACP